MAIDWARSRPLAVDLGPGETAELRCAPNTSRSPLIGATFGRADYVRLWHAGGPDDDGPVEERYPFPWLRLLLLGLALAALGVSIARGRVWGAVLLGIVALVPAAVLGAWFYARTRMGSGGSERGP